TTDVAVPTVPREPVPTHAEIDFILETAGRFLAKKPRREDVLSTFAGIRPLVTAGGGNTSSLARDHTIRADASGLITISCGKWTTCREMAEQCGDRAERMAGWKHRPCATQHLRLHGYQGHAAMFGALAVYGLDAPAIQALGGERLHPALPYVVGEVIWAVRNE